MLNKLVLFLILITCYFIVNSQDTLKIKLLDAENLFIKNNFYLLANSMNVEAQKAQIIHSKVYPNPILTGDFNAYDPDNNKTFHIGKTGQKSFQIEQLIILGGKRKAQIDYAKTNSNIAEIEFQQLILQLKFKLCSDLFSVGQLQGLLSRYNQQLNLLDTLLIAYKNQADKGNIPLKDVVRLKSAYLKLNNERSEILANYFETQTSLQTLLQTNNIIEFQFSEIDIQKYIQNKTLEELKAIAILNQPEFLIAQKNKLLAEQYIDSQSKLSIPDLNLFSSYDQRGGAFVNQLNIGFSIPLPFWDRNQGNIKTAKFKLKEANYNLLAKQNEMLTELQNAYLIYIQSASEYKKIMSIYNNDFEITINGMIENFQKRNVSIIEFIDFFEAYNEVLNEITRIKAKLVLSSEKINLLIGRDIY